MSDRYDVTARLAEGGAAVEHIGSYVRACEALGYAQPDLTAHPSQVRDWYDTEAGLDLRVLDGDTQALRAAVTAIEEALWVQRTQVTELAAAWRGSGAEAATRFLQRHCDVASDVTAHVRSAADQCATLRDELWRSVDGKVATTVAVDERRAAERSAWLAAAHALTTGSGDREAAELIVHRHVMPYVDNDIRNDWLAAMSAANSSVAASYDTAIHTLASTPDVRFEVPGDLGPTWQPPIDERPAVAAAPDMPMAADPLPTVPAAAAVPAQPALRPPPERLADEADETGSATTEPADPLGDAAGLSSGAGGLGGLGGATGGLGGVVASIVDSIGSLLGSLAGGLGGDESGDDRASLDDADDPDDVEPDDEPDDPAQPASADEDVMPETPVDSAATGPPTPEEAVGEPAAQQDDAAPPPDPPPPDSPQPVEPPASAAGAPADAKTPCEIAEDELPQAGQ